MLVLYLLIITSLFVNASEHKIIKYENQLVQTCVNFNNAVDTFLSYKTAQEKTSYFTGILKQEIQNFDDMFLKAPSIATHPLGNDIQKAFAKIVKPLENISTSVSELSTKDLKKISFERDLFFETIAILYPTKKTWSHLNHNIINNKDKTLQLNKIEEDNHFYTLDINNDQVNNIKNNLNLLPKTLSSLLNTKSNNSFIHYISQSCFAWFCNNEDATGPSEEQLDKVWAIEEHLLELNKALQQFDVLLSTELPTGIIHTIKSITQRIQAIITEYKKNYTLSDAQKEALTEIITQASQLSSQCTKKNIQACQTQIITMNYDGDIDKKTLSFLKLITRMRLFTPTNKSYFQCTKESIQQNIYTQATNGYNAVLQAAGKQVADLLINQQNQPINTVENQQPLQSVLDMVRNPQTVVKTIATQAQENVNTTIVQTGKVYMQYTKDKNKINKIHNTLLTPESYFKAFAYAFMIHMQNINNILPLHRLPVDQINHYTQFYASHVLERQVPLLLITSTVCQENNSQDNNSESQSTSDSNSDQPVIPSISDSWYTWITENQVNIKIYLKNFTEFQNDADQKNKVFLKDRDIFFTTNPLITQMPDNSAFKDMFNKKNENVLNIAFLTLPNACTKYMTIARNNIPVDCTILWKDKSFLNEWHKEIIELENNYNTKINELKSSLKSYDKLRLLLEQVKKTKLIQPFYEILKEIILFFIEFSKAMLSINKNNNISFCKEQNESFWRTYAKCTEIYNVTLNAIQRLKNEIENVLQNKSVHQ